MTENRGPIRRGAGLWLPALVAVLLVAVACSSSVGIFNKVQPRTIDAVARDGFVEDDYIVWVDCIILNEGDSGEVEVVANLSPISGGTWTEKRRVHMDGGEEAVVTFEFPRAFELRPELDHYFPGCGAFSPTTF